MKWEISGRILDDPNTTIYFKKSIVEQMEKLNGRVNKF